MVGRKSRRFPLYDERRKLKCRTPYCRRESGGKRLHSTYCSRCRTRRFKDAHPLRYSFKKLKDRALERGKDFGLTFEQYRAFAEKTDYARMKGKTSLSLSIDRIENSRGYHANNIRAITLRENSRKSFTKIPAWMVEEIKKAEAGYVPESHKNL